MWAVLVIKGFERGKTRLSGGLAPCDRVALARELGLHALDALARSEALDGLLVATDSPRVEVIAEEIGALVSRDQQGADLAAIVDDALALLAARGAPRAAVFMADLPLLQPEDVAQIKDRAHQADLTLVPNREGRGTNALALSLPTPLRTCFGHRDSLARHIERARLAGLSHQIVENPRIALDIDTSEDLRFYRSLRGQ